MGILVQLISHRFITTFLSKKPDLYLLEDKHKTIGLPKRVAPVTLKKSECFCWFLVTTWTYQRCS